MMDCSPISFDSRLSDRNTPFGSENSVLNVQKSASEMRSGIATGTGAGAAGAGALGDAGAAVVAGCDAGGTCRAHEAGVAATTSTSHALPARRFHSIDNQLTSQSAC